MKLDEAVAEVELRFDDKSVKVKALVDTGASRSVMSKAPLRRARRLYAVEGALRAEDN